MKDGLGGPRGGKNGCRFLQKVLREKAGCMKNGKEGYRLSVDGHMAGGDRVDPDEVWSVKSRSSDIILR